MKLYTADEMSRADKRAQELGIPGGVLMERAGVGMARVALEAYAPQRALVVAGGGNNGGDGFVVARELHRAGVDVAVLPTKGGYEGDPKTNFEILRNLGVRFVRCDELEAELGRAKDRKSTRLNSSHANISYAVFCLKKKQHESPRDR